MGQSDLFRREAVAAQHSRWEGRIVLVRPLSMRVATVCSAVLMVAIAGLLALGQYTRRVHVSGQIVPAAGAIRLVAPAFGRLTRISVTEDQLAVPGQVLFELSAEREGAQGGVDDRIGTMLETRRVQLL